MTTTSPPRDTNDIPAISKYSFEFGSGLDLDLDHFGSTERRGEGSNGHAYDRGDYGSREEGRAPYGAGGSLGLGGMELGNPITLNSPTAPQAAFGDGQMSGLTQRSTSPSHLAKPQQSDGFGKRDDTAYEDQPAPRLDEDVDAVLDGRRDIAVKQVSTYGAEDTRVLDSQFYPDPHVPPKINPLFQLSQSASNSSSSNPSSSRSTPGEPAELVHTVNGNGNGYAEYERKPAVHIKKVTKDAVILVADEEVVQRSGVRVEEIEGDKSKKSGSGIIGRVFGKGRKHNGQSHGHDGGQKHGVGSVDESDVPNRIGERHQNSLGIDGARGYSATPESNRNTSGSDFRPSEADELSVRNGPAPPSPPISSQYDYEEEDEFDGAGAEIVASPMMDDRVLEHDMNGRPLERHVSISGQSFTEEPESLLDEREAEQSGSRGGKRSTGSTIGEDLAEAGTVPEPRGASRTASPVDTDGDGKSTHSSYPTFSGARAGALRTGSIAASRARTPAKGSGSNNTISSAGRATSPIMDKKTLDRSLDMREPAIPSQSERPPVATPAIPIPLNSSTSMAAGAQPGHGGSYFATTAGSLAAPDAANHLHPSSASFMSTLSANSSNPAVIPPSSPYNPMTNKLERRSTSTSVNQPGQASGSSPRSPLMKSYSQIGLPGHPSPPSLASLRKATQTEVPGLQGSALDPDILAEAERLRQSRLSRRQKKRDSSDDPRTMILTGSPEPAERAPLSPGLPNGDEFAPPPRMTPSRQMSEREKEVRENLPGNVEMEKVMVGNLIGEDHVNYVLMYNMLTGIRIGVSRCQAKMKRPLTDEDFSAKHKYSFDIVGNELTPSARYDFKFKDYAPWVFRELREDYFHLDPADYLLSLTAKYILSELGSPGKSGSFFYFSRDYRFIIKTIHHAEHKYLRSILKDYYEHIRSNPHTLLSRFYGLHRVKLPRGRKIHFVIMNNLFPPHRDIHETYDLKGSAIGREYSEEKAKTNPKATLKDLNWVRRGRIFELGPEKRTLFAEQVRRDMELLKRIGVMDYSLLIGIHNMERGNRDNIRENQLSVFHPDVNMLVRRKPSSVKGNAEAQAMRKAVRRSDPKALISATAELPTSDSADRRHFLFYQDEGGLRATDEANDALDVIYYLGIIDILTPYNTVKQLEHFWRSLTVKDRHMVSCVPPDEYGSRFLAFLSSFFRDSDVSLRPRMELKSKAEEAKPKNE